MSSKPRRYAPIKTGAEYIGVSERTVRAMIADGRLVGYSLGPRVIRVDLNEIDEAMTRIGGEVE